MALWCRRTRGRLCRGTQRGCRCFSQLVTRHGSLRLASVPKVLFPLVPYRADDHLVVDDFEENDVARAAKWDDQFARSTVAQFCPTTGVG